MKKLKNKTLLNSRRNFIKKASCAAVGYTTLFSTLNSLKAANAAAITNSSVLLGGDYKALVCLMFSGGSDSFNMLIPAGNAEYNEYATTRTNLAIPQNDLLSINPTTSDGKSYGLHPAMSNIQNLFESEKIAFLTNVGSLVEPTSKTNYEQGTTDLPLGLFSHSDQQMHWQTGTPDLRSPIGWGGKIADLLQSTNNNQNISMNISLSGSNVYQAGNNTVEYAINAYDGSYGITGYDGGGLFNQLRTAAIDSLLEKQYQDVFKQSYMNTLNTAKIGHEEFSTAIDGINPFNTQFSDNDLSQSFHMIAKTIAARQTLGMSRQIFFVNYGGWDHHDEVLSAQNEMLLEVDSALSEFNSAMEEINMNDCVTTFSISEFGRTLTSNGNGTDHAWGGNVMVMGGAVNGKDIYGTFPSLELNSGQEIGGGVLIPTTSSDEYFAELAMWYGVSSTDLPLILPNIGNFYSPSGSTPPIGFMNI